MNTMLERPSDAYSGAYASLIGISTNTNQRSGATTYRFDGLVDLLAKATPGPVR